MSPPSHSAQERGSSSSEIRAHLERAETALKANKSDQAERELRKVLRLDPTNVKALGKLGVIAFLHEDWAEAAADFRKVLKLQSSQIEAQALLGMSEARLGQSADAEKLLQSSFSQLPDGKLRLQVGEDLTGIYYQKSELEKAAATVSALQRIDPNNADVAYEAYRIYADLSLQAVYSLALSAPNSPQMHEALAEHLVNEGDLKDAILEYRRALQVNPKLAGAHVELGEAILQNSRSGEAMDEAQKEFEAAVADDPADARPLCKLGDLYRSRSDAKMALQSYLRALPLNTGNGCAELGLAELLMEDGKVEQALSYLQTASRLDPFNPRIRYGLAMVYRKLKRAEDADREWATFQQLKKVRGQLRKALQEPTLPDPNGKSQSRHDPR
jgi:Flp pilus assembly protein TadD